ncbi:hypothetical protein [Neobacillus sp. SuZ13]|uniref:anti-sigma factor family protein n=1 Tax=Neobacillus sp. SuZ13 TaxID=3047875 RepID=UPI0024BF6D1D|nr:hypothetical protein [Neobacillus sp. SuZ13]WHY67471.1 hypothetical protein QNH17_02045 [Neobacillus sp. SuZ13]
MKHYSFEEWLQYVNDEVNENTKEELENHLYSCDQCLDQYLIAVEASESSLPILSDSSDFTDLVMAEVSKQKPAVPDTKKPFYQQAVFHYLLAAAATLLLTFSGVFQSLAAYANSIDKPQIQEKKPSVTEGVINKTFAWMDSLEKKEANKK